MAIIRQLNTVFKGAGANAPKLVKIDKIESAGSIFLLDVTHPYKATKSGDIVDNDVIPNLFSETLSALVGSSLNLDATVHRRIGNGTEGSPQRLKIERTGKGGIHGIVQQTAGVIVYDRYVIKFPQAVIDYINAHKDHSYYMSLWQRTTRASSYTSGGLFPSYFILTGKTAGSNIAGKVGTNGWQFNVPSLGSQATSPNSPTNHLFAAAVQNVHSEGVTAENSSPWHTGGFGAWNSSGTGGSQDKLPSQIFYRTYIEDLTVSGRTYADVFEIDNALYTKEVLTAGGRYYGDTFTDPASVVFPE